MQCVVMCCVIVIQHWLVYSSVLQCGAGRCSEVNASQCVAVRCVLDICNQHQPVRCSALQCVAVRCCALQCVAVRCSVLQCVAVPCRMVHGLL